MILYDYSGSWEAPYIKNLMQTLKLEEIEDTKGVIRIRIPK
jgi:hypothetical protein